MELQRILPQGESPTGHGQASHLLLQELHAPTMEEQLAEGVRERLGHKLAQVARLQHFQDQDTFHRSRLQDIATHISERALEAQS